MQQIERLEITSSRNCAHCTEEDYQICKSNLETCPRFIRLPEGVGIASFENYIERYLGVWKFPVLGTKP